MKKYDIKASKNKKKKWREKWKRKWMVWTLMAVFDWRVKTQEETEGTRSGMKIDWHLLTTNLHICVASLSPNK